MPLTVGIIGSIPVTSIATYTDIGCWVWVQLVSWSYSLTGFDRSTTYKWGRVISVLKFETEYVNGFQYSFHFGLENKFMSLTDYS